MTLWKLIPTIDIVLFVIMVNLGHCVNLTNLISNSSFQLPRLPSSGYLFQTAQGWSGQLFQLMNLYRTLGYGQYIDLQYGSRQNGYIQQNITLSAQGNCTLSFLQQAKSTSYFNYVMEIYWNGVLLATQIAKTTATTLEEFVVYGVVGENLVMFKEVGIDTDYNGMFLDQVSLTCDPATQIKPPTPTPTPVINQTTPTPTPTPSPPSPPTIIITVQSSWNPYSGILYLTTDCQISNYGLTLQFFTQCIVQINRQLQIKMRYYLDVNGCLAMEIQPNVVYVSSYVSQLKVYIPEEIFGEGDSRVVFVVDGEEIGLEELSIGEKRVMEQIQPYAEQITMLTKQAFVYLNMFYCSFFILGLIQFWNLTLIYNFLPLKTIPKFTQAFFSKMINFFFTFNSFSISISQLTNAPTKAQPLLNFTILTSTQKILPSKNGHIWFGFTGLSSNYMGNNFDTLVLLGIFLGKSVVVRVVGAWLRRRGVGVGVVGFRRIFRQFCREVLCFGPFVLVSALQVFLYMGETNYYGRLNNTLHVITVFLILILQSLTFLKSSSKTHWSHSSTKPKKLSQNLIQILFSLLIPTLVVLHNTLAFFIIVSLLLLIRCISFFKNNKIYNKFQKVVKFVTNVVWVGYHCCFVGFYVLEKMGNQGAGGNGGGNGGIAKGLGFAAILCVLVGGFFDILECFVKILGLCFRILRFLYRYCSGKERAQQRNKKSTKSTKSIKSKKSLAKKQLSFSQLVKKASPKRKTNIPSKNPGINRKSRFHKSPSPSPSPNPNPNTPQNKDTKKVTYIPVQKITTTNTNNNNNIIRIIVTTKAYREMGMGIGRKRTREREQKK